MGDRRFAFTGQCMSQAVEEPMRVRLWTLIAFAGLLLAVVPTGRQDILSKLLPVVQAQQTPVTLRVSDLDTGSPDGTCQPGGPVVMRISVEAAQGIAALSIELQFDQDVATLHADGVSAGADIPGGWLFVTNPDTPGKLVIGMIGTTTPNADSFTIADVTFDCDDSPGRATNLTFSNVVASDVNTVELPTESVGGPLEIAAAGIITPPIVDLSVQATVDPDLVTPGNQLAYTVSVTVGVQR